MYQGTPKEPKRFWFGSAQAGWLTDTRGKTPGSIFFLKYDKMGLQNKKGIDDPAKLDYLLDRIQDQLLWECKHPAMCCCLLLKQPIKFLSFDRHKDHSVWFQLCCFNDEWKLQSFSFNDSVSLKYGIVQNKAGCF